jgi:hypothetical protein
MSTKNKVKSSLKEGKRILREGILDRFISSFFDAYKNGVEKAFIDRASERTSPEMKKVLTKFAQDVQKNEKELEKLIADLKKKQNK